MSIQKYNLCLRSCFCILQSSSFRRLFPPALPEIFEIHKVLPQISDFAAGKTRSKIRQSKEYRTGSDMSETSSTGPCCLPYRFYIEGISTKNARNITAKNARAKIAARFRCFDVINTNFIINSSHKIFVYSMNAAGILLQIPAADIYFFTDIKNFFDFFCIMC